jgi:hypothetical protein
MEIKLTMTLDEANAVLQVLGNLPTSSGVYPLLMKLKMQAEEQLPKSEPVAS